MKRFWSILALVALVGAACAEDEPAVDTGGATTTTGGGAGSAAEVAVTATDFAFDMPAEIEAGVTQFTMTNSGQEGHIGVLAKIPAGKTFADVQAGFAQEGPPPVEDVAGIASVSPGESSNMTLDVEAGDYVFVCYLPSPDGVPHVAKGMLTPVKVATSDSTAALPEADVEVTLADFSISTVPALEAGEVVFGLDNQGPQVHETNLVELAAGKTVKDLTDFLGSPTGPPPGTFLGGMAVEKGVPGTWRADLEAGKQYVFLCLIPDVLGDMQPHFTKGMITPVFSPS